MAIRASVLESVTGHAGALIEHRQLGVCAGLEQRQRLVTPRQFIVTADAIIGGVAGGASSTIERREFAVDVVLPSGGMRCRLHHLMTSHALAFRREGRCHILMACETFGIRRRGIVLVMDAKTFGVRWRFHCSFVAGWSEASYGIDVTDGAVGHTKLRRDSLRSVVTCDAVQHGRECEVRQSAARQDRGMACCAICLVVGVGKLYVAVPARDNMQRNLLGLLRRVAAATLALGYRSAQVWLHSGFGMATGALDMGWKFCLNPVWLQFVTEGAV